MEEGGARTYLRYAGNSALYRRCGCTVLVRVHAAVSYSSLNYAHNPNSGRGLLVGKYALCLLKGFFEPISAFRVPKTRIPHNKVSYRGGQVSRGLSFLRCSLRFLPALRRNNKQGKYLTWGFFVHFFPFSSTQSVFGFLLPLFGFTQNVGAASLPVEIKLRIVGCRQVSNPNPVPHFGVTGRALGLPLGPRTATYPRPAEMALQVSSDSLIHSSWCVELTLWVLPIHPRGIVSASQSGTVSYKKIKGYKRSLTLDETLRKRAFLPWSFWKEECRPTGVL